MQLALAVQWYGKQPWLCGESNGALGATRDRYQICGAFGSRIGNAWKHRRFMGCVASYLGFGHSARLASLAAAIAALKNLGLNGYANDRGN